MSSPWHYEYNFELIYAHNSACFMHNGNQVETRHLFFKDKKVVTKWSVKKFDYDVKRSFLLFFYCELLRKQMTLMINGIFHVNFYHL